MKTKLSSVLKSAKAKAIPITIREAKEDKFTWPDGTPIDTQHMLISMMLPPAVKAFYEELERDVELLCGKRGEHDNADGHRWGSQKGSVFFANQRLAIEHPRVRSKSTGEEIVPETYARFQSPRLFEQTVFTEGMKHVSQRDFEKGLPKVAASFGVTKSSISRRWIKATAKKFDELMNRDIAVMDIVAIFIDGKRFRTEGVVVALGVSSTGTKFVLGIYQANTETGDAVMNLLNDMEGRGLPKINLLFIVDGGTGLNRALNEKYLCNNPEKRKAVRVRCYFHKWQNIDKCLGGKDEKIAADAATLFWSIRTAGSLSEAKAAALSFKNHMRLINKSVVKTFEEAEADLMVIHELNLTADLKATLSTTNPIESLNSLTEEDLRRVKRWRDAEHFSRWLATAVLHGEKRMKKVKGYRGLTGLKIALAALCCRNEKEIIDNEVSIAG